MRSKIALFFLATLLVIESEIIRGEEKSIAPDFGRYPQTNVFKGILADHKPSSDLIVISQLIGNNGGEVHFSISTTGKENDYVFVNAGGDGEEVEGRGSHEKKLSEGQLTQLKAAILDLPDENVFPSVDHLVIVSVRKNSTWVTRCYDHEKTPPALQKIYDIISASKNVR